MKRRRGITAVFWFAAVLSCAVASVHAYILRAPHVLDLMLRDYGRPRNMLVTQKVLFLGPEGEVDAEAEETLRYVQPDMFRADTRSEHASRIHLTAGGKAVSVIDGRIADAGETLFDTYKDLLLYRSRNLLQERLAQRGIDMSVTAYGRFEEKIAFVLGAERPGDPVPQVWIDKATFLPVRWMMTGGEAGEPPAGVEARYSEWRRFDGVVYPMRVEFYQDGRPVREIRVESLRTDLTFPAELFDVESLRLKYMSAAPEAKDAAVSGDISEIEKSIDEFRKKYE